MLLLLVSTQVAPATAGFINMSLVLGDLWPPLNATGPQDAIFWQPSELYAWLDEAAKRMARKLGPFVEYDTTISTQANVSGYQLPVSHIATIQADFNGIVLRARNVQELEAFDSQWTAAASAPPVAFVQDTQGLQRLTLYPPPDVPSQNLPIGLLMQEDPAQITQANAILPAPNCLQDYFAFFALAEARATKETNASMDDTAQWFRQILQNYEQVIAGLWK